MALNRGCSMSVSLFASFRLGYAALRTEAAFGLSLQPLTHYRYIGTPRAFIVERRRRKRLPLDTTVGNSILDMEFLQENFDGDLEEYEREAEELTEAQLTVYRVTTYPRKTWKKNFFSDEEFRRKVVMPARKLILAEGGVTEISKEE